MWLFGKLRVGFKYVQKHGLGFEWWNFYEGFDKEYYYGYLPPIHKLKPNDLIDGGVIFQVSKNVFDGEWYLVGIYGGVEILSKGLSHGHIVWSSIPIKYRNMFSDETVNEVFSGNYFYVKARKEYSTPIPKPMPIDWEKDFGTPVLRQAFFAYLDTEVALSVLDKTIEYVEELKEGKVGVTCLDIDVASRRLRKLRKILKEYVDRDSVAITSHSMYYVGGSSRKEYVNRYVSYVGSRSKYDGYWLSMIDELRGAVRRAYVDGVVVIDVGDIARYGRRKPESWYGSVVVCKDGVRDKRVVMAHLRSLARILVEEGVLAGYDVCFRFKMTRDRKLVVEKVLQNEGIVGKRSVGEGLARYTEYRGGSYVSLPLRMQHSVSTGYVSGSYVGLILPLRYKAPNVKPLQRRFKFAGLELRGIIGVGGFAATFLGVDDVGRSFVVKVPKEILASLMYGVTYTPSERGLKAFMKELDVLRSLRHPHIVEVVYGGINEGVPYIVMEFCENGSLRGVLGNEGRIGLKEALIIGVQVADVLRYIHSVGIAHRDLKPENILFTKEGLLKVTDFNIAKIMRAVSPTTSTTVPYTAGYAAPEQVFKDYGKTGPWSDIWSLGIILYEALTGELPFDPWDYEESIKEGPKLEKLPEETRNIIAKMLSEKISERPTAQQVEEELENILKNINH